MDRIAMHIRILNIREISFIDFLKEKNEKPVGEINVRLSIKPIPELDNHTITLELGLFYYTGNKRNPHPVLDYKIATLFDVANLDELTRIKHEWLVISPELLTIMAGVSIGSLRGMLALRTQGSYYENHPLPIINISQLVANMQGTTLKETVSEPLLKFKYE